MNEVRSTPAWVVLSMLGCIAVLGFWNGMSNSLEQARCIATAAPADLGLPTLIAPPAKTVARPTELPKEVITEPKKVEPPKTEAQIQQEAALALEAEKAKAIKGADLPKIPPPARLEPPAASASPPPEPAPAVAATPEPATPVPPPEEALN